MHRSWLKRIIGAIFLCMQIIEFLCKPFTLVLSHGFNFFIKSCKFVHELWLVFAGLILIVGRVTIVLLVATSTIVLVYLILHESGIPWPYIDKYYPIAAKVLENKVAWAAITVFLGSIVAMGHLLDLELNQKKHIQEQEDKWLKKYEEKMQRHTQCLTHPSSGTR